MALDIISTVVTVGKSIYEIVNEVKNFKNQSKTLARRIYVIVEPVEVLRKEVVEGKTKLPADKEATKKDRGSSGGDCDNDPVTFIRSLGDLAECIQQVHKFLEEMSTVNTLNKFLKKNKISGKFDGFNNQLTTLQQSLTLSLQVTLKKSFSGEMRKRMEEEFNHYTMIKQKLKDMEEDLADISTLLISAEETNEIVKDMQNQVQELKQLLDNRTQEAYEGDLRIDFADCTELQEIHAGTYGPIYKTKHRLEDKMLVYKTYSDTAQFAREELREQLNLWKKLRFSKFIVQLYGYTVDEEGQMSFVVEYMPLGTLRNVLSDVTYPLPWEQRRMLARDCAQGLYAIHYSMGKLMLHRAVTSTRFLVDERFRAKISDNGFVRSASKISKTNRTKPGNLEQDEMIYLCPEETQADFKRTVKSEIYKFGVILYEIASRMKPFQSLEKDGNALSEDEICSFIENGKTEDPPLETPDDFRELIKDCRHMIPKERPSTTDVVTRLNEMC